MAVNVAKPLAWKSANAGELVMLSELQADVLRGHVRDHLTVMFFNVANRAAGRAFLRALVPLVKSALTHLQEVEVFKPTQGIARGSVYVGVGLTASGYRAIGVPAGSVRADASFRKGMRARRRTLGDPLPSSWDSAYQRRIDLIVQVVDDNATSVASARAQVLAAKPASVTLLGEETGLSQTNSNGRGIEHFGYVDGRSQPLFLAEQIAGEPKTKWDPAFSPRQLIVADAAAPATAALPPVSKGLFFGSYFVFRKLEQDVRAFRQAEDELATSLGLLGADRERAGAMIVGRFRDGTALVVQGTHGQTPSALGNNVGYSNDATGARCPFHAQFRNTDPRGTGGLGVPPATERSHLMARRGQTYGVRTDDPSDVSVPNGQRPSRGVGLLFMAFKAYTASQFEFTQQSWANSAGFPQAPAGMTPGVDDVIGHGPDSPEVRDDLRHRIVDHRCASVPASRDVKGGEYCFMPSLAFLRSL